MNKKHKYKLLTDDEKNKLILRLKHKVNTLIRKLKELKETIKKQERPSSSLCNNEDELFKMELLGNYKTW